VIKCEQGNPTATTPIREGRNLSLLETATGRVFLAYLSELETGKFLSREIELRKKASPGFKGISAEEIDSLKAKVRKEGLVCSTAKLGNEALAAPVFDHRGRVTMVLALFARAGTADLNPSHRPAMKLREAAPARHEVARSSTFPFETLRRAGRLSRKP
jgi:DNA-binding IclR family transcriptional regulator